MSFYNWKLEQIAELTKRIKKENLRIFIAEKGTYGFYTDEKGERIISFQIDLILTFSGNYKSDKNGTGWRICEGMPNITFKELLYSSSPFKFNHYTSLQEHLKMYQASSKYIEI